MPFLQRGTVVVDVTDLSADGQQYWVKIKDKLPGAELDRIEAARVQVGVGADVSKAAEVTAERKRRQAAGLPVNDAEDDLAATAMVRIDTAAYKMALLMAGIVDWNLTDEYDRPLMLDTPMHKRDSLELLDDLVYNRLFERLEAIAKHSERDAAAEADFPQPVPVGGPHPQNLEPAYPGRVAEGGVVVADWADPRASVGALQSA